MSCSERYICISCCSSGIPVCKLLSVCCVGIHFVCDQWVGLGLVRQARGIPPCNSGTWHLISLFDICKLLSIEDMKVGKIYPYFAGLVCYCLCTWKLFCGFFTPIVGPFGHPRAVLANEMANRAVPVNRTVPRVKEKRPYTTFLLFFLLFFCFLYFSLRLFGFPFSVFGFYFAFQGSFHFGFSTWLNHRKISVLWHLCMPWDCKREIQVKTY